VVTSGDSLLCKAIGGNRCALAQLLEEHTPTLWERVARKIPRRWRSVLSVEDVLQQAYTNAFLCIGRFDPAGAASFATWLTSLAWHNLADAVRMLEAEKRGGGRRRVTPHSREDSFAALYDMLSAAGATPSREVARRERHKALEEAIRHLPETHRQVVQMYDLEGRPVSEVAAALSRSPGAVYMIRARAHARLCELMGN